MADDGKHGTCTLSEESVRQGAVDHYVRYVLCFRCFYMFHLVLAFFGI